MRYQLGQRVMIRGKHSKRPGIWGLFNGYLGTILEHHLQPETYLVQVDGAGVVRCPKENLTGIRHDSGDTSRVPENVRPLERHVFRDLS